MNSVPLASKYVGVSIGTGSLVVLPHFLSSIYTAQLPWWQWQKVESSYASNSLFYAMWIEEFSTGKGNIHVCCVCIDRKKHVILLFSYLMPLSWWSCLIILAKNIFCVTMKVYGSHHVHILSLDEEKLKAPTLTVCDKLCIALQLKRLVIPTFKLTNCKCILTKGNEDTTRPPKRSHTERWGYFHQW